MQFEKVIRGILPMLGLWSSERQFVISLKVSYQEFFVMFVMFKAAKKLILDVFQPQPRMVCPTHLTRFWLAMGPNSVFCKLWLQFVLQGMR